MICCSRHTSRVYRSVKSSHSPGGDAVRDLIYRNAHEIRNGGHTLVLRWVPSHSKISGNEKADAAAKDVAYKGGRETDHWSSLTHIKAELQKTRSAELLMWHQSKSQEREATVQGFYVPQARSNINDRRLMIDYCEHPTKVGGSTCDGISPGRGKVRLRLARKDGSEGLILNLPNVYFLLNSPSNLVNPCLA